MNFAELTVSLSSDPKYSSTSGAVRLVLTKCFINGMFIERKNFRRPKDDSSKTRLAFWTNSDSGVSCEPKKVLD